MNRIWFRLLAVSVLSGVTGCSFYARGPEDYRKDTRALLETRNPQIKTCYDEALKSSTGASGTVVVNFTVEEKTGKIKDPTVLPRSTAPAPLGECIVNALDGLALEPPDQRKGDATFTWEFQRG